MVKQRKFITKSAEETQRAGFDFARSLLALGDSLTRVIALYGELGSGKTTFVQGLAKGLGITRRIISPTFIIVRNYKIKADSGQARMTNSRTVNFYHIDLYRTENKQDLEGLGIEEILNDQNAIVAIEWAEKMGSLLAKNAKQVHFRYVNEQEREITFEIKNQK